jgi:hypothetical protein
MRTATGRFWIQFQQGTYFKVRVLVQAGYWFQDSSSRSSSNSSRMLIPSIVMSSWSARFPFWFYQEVCSKVQFYNKRLVVPWYCSPECRTCQVSQNQLRDQNRSNPPNQSALLALSLSLSVHLSFVLIELTHIPALLDHLPPLCLLDHMITRTSQLNNSQMFHPALVQSSEVAM